MVRASFVKRNYWLLPGLLALVFVLMVGAWASVNDATEQRAFAQTLASDAASVEAQIVARLEVERARLRDIARQLPLESAKNRTGFAELPEVQAGLQRLSNRLVWLDDKLRLLASAERPAQWSGLEDSTDLRIQMRGQAEHLVVPAPGGYGQPGGQLLARYEITDLLGSTDLAWLNRRYEVSFLSELGEVIATTAHPQRIAHGAPFERHLVSSTDTRLILRPYDMPILWWRSPRTFALLAGLLLLGAGGSLLLRREMRRVAQAVADAQTEAAWRQSMEDSALVGLRARDTEGSILYVNKTLCDMVGYSAHELIGSRPPLPFWPPDAVDAMMARNLDTLAGAAPATGFESRWQHRDGHFIDVMIFESRLHDPQGQHIGWMGSIVDISDRKLLEEKNRRYTALMAQHARLSDLGLLASELAHELNQPLATVIAYSSGLSMAVRKMEQASPDILAALDALQKNARKAGDIVHWIRRQTSRVPAQHQRLDMAALVAEVLAMHRHTFQQAGVALKWTPPNSECPVLADRVGIEQVLGNLLRNALEALSEQQSRTGYVRITLTSHHAPEGGGGSVELAVSDNGPGMQGRNIDDLCATFYSTKTQGMGLGLGICRSIVESHGGTFSASDAESGGAIFRFSLPMAAPLSPSPPESLP
ncbi:two-component system, LuxR family, sensor histidine kinase DctS [Giesbergeria anulus]|uniref:histidine kinase n=1 Tax=Giesbergeria anulus TaxID=180197 RepID=A0A1H9HYP6_9BURK|nr:two-component system, LuxR family, sensor histidine kinase DctS [Giesbergeria anulus]